MKSAASPLLARPTLVESRGGGLKGTDWAVPRFFRSNYLWIIIATLISVPALLAYLGVRATQEWQRSTRMLVEQRTSEVVTLMILALNRDMRAVQAEVLPQLESLNVQPAVYDLADEATTAFGRFPYPESFFTWTGRGKSQDSFYVFTRSDRPPPWHREGSSTLGFPTSVLNDPPELRPLISLLRNDAMAGSHVLTLETQFHGDTYQVVAQARYGTQLGAGIESLVGFMVNLTWVRNYYFSDLLNQLSNVLAANSTMSMMILDDKGGLVAATTSRHPDETGLPMHKERFPLLFFDPLLSNTLHNETVPVRYWIAEAKPIRGESMLVAARGASRTVILIAVTALAASVALIFAIISARAAAVLAAMKSEFVSSVTHELKTPLSSIRLVSETLVRGRYHSQEVIVECAELLLNEVSRLTRTIDNLLSMSRVQDVGAFYLFESVDLLTLVEEALSRFELQLRELRFDVHLDIPPSLPHVRADRAAILQVLDNLLDNAIRYSNGHRSLNVSASSSGDRVSLCIADQGRGIPSDELPRIFDKFFRGRGTASVGSGLGLAIADRVLKDHDGGIRLHSVEGHGTTAEIELCVAEEERNK